MDWREIAWWGFRPIWKAVFNLCQKDVHFLGNNTCCVPYGSVPVPVPFVIYTIPLCQNNPLETGYHSFHISMIPNCIWRPGHQTCPLNIILFPGWNLNLQSYVNGCKQRSPEVVIIITTITIITIFITISIISSESSASSFSSSSQPTYMWHSTFMKQRYFTTKIGVTLYLPTVVVGMSKYRRKRHSLSAKEPLTNKSAYNKSVLDQIFWCFKFVSNSVSSMST